MRKLLAVVLLSLVIVSPVMAATNSYLTLAAGWAQTITLGDAYWVALAPRTNDLSVVTYYSVSGTQTVRDTFLIPAGASKTFSADGVSQILLISTLGTVVDYNISRFKEFGPVIFPDLVTSIEAVTTDTDSLIVIADSLKTLFGGIIDGEGVWSSPGLTEIELNDGTTDLTTASADYVLAVDISGFREVTFKCLADSSTGVTPVYFYSSQTGNTQMLTGNCAVFDRTPGDSTVATWYLPERGSKAADGLATFASKAIYGTTLIPVMNDDGAWISGSYALMKIDPNCRIWNLKVIAILRK